ncbi:MAG: hypothetical protein Q7S28_00335 [bacterium]|nr:hypothetical protein [bacterium]
MWQWFLRALENFSRSFFVIPAKTTEDAWMNMILFIGLVLIVGYVGLTLVRLPFALAARLYFRNKPAWHTSRGIPVYRYISLTLHEQTYPYRDKSGKRHDASDRHVAHILANFDWKGWNKAIRKIDKFQQAQGLPPIQGMPPEDEG